MSRDLFYGIDKGTFLRVECGHDQQGRRVVCFGHLVAMQEQHVVLQCDRDLVVVAHDQVLRVTLLD